MTKVNGITVDNTNNYSGSTQKISTDDFSSYLGENKSLDTIFDRAADKYNVPVELLKAVGKTESNFNKDAVSRCGAQGVMQLMPATAKGLGVTNSFDPEQNIMGGAKYISGLLKKYDGNTSFALAAYNAGSGNVAKYGGVPPFTETQNYVKKVIGYMKQGGLDTSSGDYCSKDYSSDSNALHVASAEVPTPIQSNYAYLLNSGSADNSVNNLDELFSYEDYLKFMDMFLNETKEIGTLDKNAGYSAKDINYNAPVLNLLTAQK